MARNYTSAAHRFAEVSKALLKIPSVTVGSGKKGFGSSALQINGKIFAMLTSKERFVVKLPKQRVESLFSSGDGKRFDPGHGRLMNEWFEVSESSAVSWLALAKEALAFVGSKSQPRRH